MDNAGGMKQHYRLEWNNESGIREVVARIYIGPRRTSAFVPVPAGEPDGNVGRETWKQAQAMYAEEDAREF